MYLRPTEWNLWAVVTDYNRSPSSRNPSSLSQNHNPSLTIWSCLPTTAKYSQDMQDPNLETVPSRVIWNASRKKKFIYYFFNKSSLCFCQWHFCSYVKIARTKTTEEECIPVHTSRVPDVHNGGKTMVTRAGHWEMASQWHTGRRESSLEVGCGYKLKTCFHFLLQVSMI